jgi:hypothetical protein
MGGKSWSVLELSNSLTPNRFFLLTAQSFFQFRRQQQGMMRPTTEVSTEAGMLAKATDRLPVTCHQARM